MAMASSRAAAAAAAAGASAAVAPRPTASPVATSSTGPCAPLRTSAFSQLQRPRAQKITGAKLPLHLQPRQVLRRNSEFDAEEAKPDFIERLVVGIFGKKALQDPEPMGMKRMAADDFPEMYPATTTEFAAPLEADSEEVAAFRPLLAKTQLEAKPLKLIYSGEDCGWDADMFHRCVDSMGAAVVLGRTEGGAIFGGYNPRGWIGIGEDRDAIAAFLFTWPDGDQSKPACKMPKVGGPSMAVIDKADSGIQFGAEGLTIQLGSTGSGAKMAKCRLGTYYARLPDGGRSLFAEGESIKAAELTDLKVYVAEGNGEEWELNGIVWNTKTAAQ